VTSTENSKFTFLQVEQQAYMRVPLEISKDRVPLSQENDSQWVLSIVWSLPPVYKDT